VARIVCEPAHTGTKNLSCSAFAKTIVAAATSATAIRDTGASGSRRLGLSAGNPLEPLSAFHKRAPCLQALSKALRGQSRDERTLRLAESGKDADGGGTPRTPSSLVPGERRHVL